MPRIDAKKICLIRTSALGDTVHALALVNGLRKGYPDAHLTWVLQTVAHDMVRHQKNVDQFIPFNRKGSLRDWLTLFRRLRADAYDLVIVPQASAKASLLALAARSPRKLGFDFHRSREMHWLAVNRRIPPAPMRHVQDQFFEFLDYLEIRDYPVEWNFIFTEEEQAWRRAFFAKFPRPVIGFVAASSAREKDWDLKKYAAVMDFVDRDLNLQPMIIGGPSAIERQYAETIRGLCRRPPAVALEKPIRRTLLQLSGCRLVVAPDTGPLHMAVALNVPTIGLYGYSDPRRCGPYRKYHDLLIDRFNEPGDANAPVTRKTKPGRMARISAEDVMEKIRLGLETYPAPEKEF